MADHVQEASDPVIGTAVKPDDEKTPVGSPTVRFSSVNQEIEPEHTLNLSTDVSSPSQKLSGETEAELRALSGSIQGTHLQTRRMSNFNFDPLSLPASRVASHEESSHEPSRHNTRSSGRPSPRGSPLVSAMHSPPLTPAATHSNDEAKDDTAAGAPLEKVDDKVEGPQVEISTSSSPSLVDSQPQSSGLSTRPTTRSHESFDSTGRKKTYEHHGKFIVGPSIKDSDSASVPASRDISRDVSRDTSPSRSAAAYSRPFTPAGDINDPYAASKRAPQSKNLDAIEPRFVFSSRTARSRTSPIASTPLPRSTRSSADLSKEKRHSHFGKKDPSLSHLHDDSSTSIHSKGSMSELKRFLKIGSHHKAKRAASPTGSNKSGSKTPPQNKTPQQLPFGDDHGLTSKYGKFGKVLGAGAGGSVRLMKRSSDGTTFAVKEFRARHTYETEREYAKKVTAEFCIGSTLHHGNIIETLDIVHEKGKWYEVMEYAPYDLFAIVMTGKMSREEVTCSFLQILSGVTYLHAVGLAHRDLKLDNVVVNEHGIMKIIDFGSASMFKYPFENEIVLASGIVGSDPYLAPEVYDERKYDPQPTDIWSLAIIFCCMSLRRFPWKMPRMTDNSYKLFASPPSPGTDIRRSSDMPASSSEGDIPHAHDGHANGSVPHSASTVSEPTKDKAEVIKGPWRLLRLLPRESRHIIGRMLEIDPKARATMAEVLDDPWVRDTVICRQEESGTVVSAPGHTHTLEGPAPAPAK